jgi:tripartite-type tricarboxylate transporter receptor subunit TctC
MVTRRAMLAGLAGLGLPGVRPLRAADRKPLRVVVPFAAGSAPDLLARLLAERWERPVVVVNMPGAGGNLGVDHVAKAEKDGHTLVLAGDAAITVNPAIYEHMPFDPRRDLAPVSQIAVTPNLLVVAANSPIRSVADIVALARAEPGRQTYASAGAGTSSHRAGEMLKRAEGLDIAHVPYRNSPLPDVLSGNVGFFFANVATALPLVREGKLRALAASSRQRLAVAPDVPTMIELGYEGFEAVAWFGLLAPAGTPPGMITGLHAELAVIGSEPDVRSRLFAMGAEPIFSAPDAFAALIAAETSKWALLMKRTGIKVQ